MKYMLFGSNLLLLLTVMDALLESSWLPLGGSAISEVGVILGISFAFATIHELFWKNK